MTYDLKNKDTRNATSISIFFFHDYLLLPYLLKGHLKGPSHLNFRSPLGKIALGPPLNFVFSSSPPPQSFPHFSSPPYQLEFQVPLK